MGAATARATGPRASRRTGLFSGIVLAVVILLSAQRALPQQAADGTASNDALIVTVDGLDKDRHLPPASAYCAPASLAPDAHNISPAVSWSDGPKGTRSYALIMTDLDVPQDLSLINKPGVFILEDAPRMPLIHWVLVDIPATITRLESGVESDGFVPKGKPLGPTSKGVRGANAYSNFYPKDSPLAGPHGGFDGPCPPKNDAISHRYVTYVYALDVPSLGLSGLFTGETALAKMSGHILARGSAEALFGEGPAPNAARASTADR